MLHDLTLIIPVFLNHKRLSCNNNNNNTRSTYLETWRQEEQKTTILGTDHILQEVLMQKYETFIVMGNNILRAI